MNINWGAIIAATVLQFIWGAVWYTALFGKMWGKIHGFDKLSKDVQEKMMKGMGPIYGIQFGITLLTTIVLAIFVAYQPSWNAYAMAGFFWIGFVVPTQTSSVLFGGTEPRWMWKKIAVQAGASLGSLEIATMVLSMWR
jgi:hypothetical protein